MSDFQLHSQLQKDLVFLGELDLCLAMLLPDSENPWVVLVPQVPNIKEWHQLCEKQQIQLTQEICKMSKLLEDEFQPDKINVGALGNMVPQLHVHIIARYKSDRAWPGSIWGTPSGRDEQRIDAIEAKIIKKLKE